MSMYSAILLIHVIATLGIVAALSVEAFAIRQLQRAAEADLLAWLDAIEQMRVVSTVCLLVLFFSGGYLAHLSRLWTFAWPKMAVVVLIAFGALAGISGSGIAQLRKTLQSSDEITSRCAVHKPLFTISLSLRTGLVVAAVYLMSFQPGFAQALGAVLVLLLIFWIAGVSGSKRSPRAARWR